jgi:hypothetical protein
MARLGPELRSVLKCFHALPRDSFFFCLKDRTSKRSLTTLEMEKNCKQKLEHRASQSLCLLPMVSLYQCLAFPVKEKGKSFHCKVSCDMPSMRRHAHVCSNSFRWE